MIKLPDFTRCVEMQKLFVSMGIREISVQPLPQGTFVRKVVKKISVTVKNTEQLRFRDELKLKSLLFSPDDLRISPSGLLELNGTNCCIYIKNQSQGYDLYNKTSSYKFHLCECNTIESMIQNGRKGRYVATTRDDGLFPVNVIGDYSNIHNTLLSLELCDNCKRILKLKNMYFTPFNLKEFFEKFQSEINQTFQKEETVLAEEPYAPNQKEIADAYKKQCKYHCQLCGVDCSNNKTCLHLHHKDGNGHHNNPDNLIVLCAACHADQYMHSHMNGAFADEIDLVKRLRKDQGIF